jgi:hypothetical protein
MARYAPEELGFIDEVSKNERTIGRHYGRSRRGRRARKAQPFVRGRRTSTIGCLTLDGFVSGTSVEGSFTKATFLHWLEHSLVRACTLSLVYDCSLSADAQVLCIPRPSQRPRPRQCQDPSRLRASRAR